MRGIAHSRTGRGPALVITVVLLGSAGCAEDMSEDELIRSNLRSVAAAQQSYFETHGRYTGQFVDLRDFHLDGAIHLRIVHASATAYCVLGDVDGRNTTYLHGPSGTIDEKPC